MKYLLPILIILLFACSEVDEDLENAERALHEQLLIEMEISQMPTLSAAIVDQRRITWQITEKLDNFSVFQTPDAHSIYVLGQVSKLFAAVAVMQLVEQGQIDLDDDVNHHIPYFIGNRFHPDEPITVRQLLINNSSISPYAYYTYDFSYLQFEHYDTILTLTPVIRDYISPRGVKHDSTIWTPYKPGSVVEASNLGATLLAYLVEEVAGIPYQEYCRQNIFEPLNMYNTGYFLNELDEDSRLEIYYTDPPLIAVDLYNTSLFPAYSAKSTLTDLSHFVIAILNGGNYAGAQVLTGESVDEMLDIHDKSTLLPFESGAGYMWYAPFNDPWIGHSGSVFGSSTSIYLNRQLGVGMIMLTNRGGRNSVHPGFPTYEQIRKHIEDYY